MELPVSPKSPKRQVTLGPDAPIREWEVERATLVIENKEYKEKAERLEKKVNNDLVTYENNRSSLLKEVKLKEALLEKKLKDVEEQLTSQILELQHQLNNEGTSHQEAIQTLKQHHDSILEAEDRKHQRRIVSLQDRLKAKDTEYTELLGKQEENKIEEDQEDERDKLIQSLKLGLEQEKDVRKAEQEKWQKESEHHIELHNNEASDASILNQLESLQSTYQQVQAELNTSRTELQDVVEREQKHLERIQALESDLSSARTEADGHQKRMAHAISGHGTYIREITEKFNTEAQHAQMSTQAQMQNLQSEHNEMMRELREQQETEREVWMIEKKDALDHAARQAHIDKEEALRVQNREWKDKFDDLQASMSKDASEIQTHWEKKLEEQKAKSQTQVAHLQGEMGVVKERLGHEIDRRKQNQASLVDTINLCELFKERSTKYENKAEKYSRKYADAQRNLDKLHFQYRSSHRLALDLLSVTSSENTSHTQSSLPDILHNVIRNASIMRVQRETNNDQILYEMDALPTFSF